MSGENLLTIEDVAKRIGVSEATIHRYRRAGQFPPAVALPGRTPKPCRDGKVRGAIRWREREIDQWIRSLKPVEA